MAEWEHLKACTNTIQELVARKSVRAFTGEPISAEYKRLILEAAVNAPSAGCQQLYTIIDVTDQKIKEKGRVKKLSFFHTPLCISETSRLACESCVPCAWQSPSAFPG